MHVMWRALADHVAARGIEILFGVASFHGTDLQALAAPLSLLHHRHLAPPALRVRARPPGAAPMNLVAEDALDRRAAMLAVPALIKAYLRLGGLRRRGGLRRSRFQHHRRVPGAGHGPRRPGGRARYLRGDAG